MSSTVPEKTPQILLNLFLTKVTELMRTFVAAPFLRAMLTFAHVIALDSHY